MRPVGISVHATDDKDASLELDFHADTFCVGKEALVIYDYDRPVAVSGYDPQLESRDFKKLSAVLDYTHPLTGQIYHLAIHQAIQIHNLDHQLLFPMQCRVNDIYTNFGLKYGTKVGVTCNIRRWHCQGGHLTDNQCVVIVIFSH